MVQQLQQLNIYLQGNHDFKDKQLEMGEPQVEEKPEEPDPTSVEEALERLGGFSWFQITVTCVVLLSEIPTAMIAISPVFVGASNVEFLCEYNDTLERFSADHPDICGLKCEHIPDEPITSIVQEWFLICDKAWISDLITSIQMLGMMTGSLTASQLADAFGRRTVFYTMIAIMGSCGSASGLATDMYTFAVVRYLTGIGLGGFYVIFFIFLMEFLTPNWRTISGCLTLWSGGIMLLALLAYHLPPWRHLTFAISGVALVMLVFYPLVPESPRWLLTKKKTAKAEKSLTRIATMNRRPPLSTAAVESLQMSVLKGLESDNQKEKQTALEIFRRPDLRYKLLIFTFGWYSVSTVYYSMSFNTKNMVGDPYMNVFYMGLVDLPAFPSGIWFNNKFGRKKTYAGYLLFASIFLLTLVIINEVLGSEGHENLIVILSYCGRFGIAGAWGVVNCFTAESFPTICRSTALGMCALCADIGGVLAPQLAYMGSLEPSAPYYVFAGLSIAAACSPYLLKETNQKPLENFVKA